MKAQAKLQSLRELDMSVETPMRRTLSKSVLKQLDSADRGINFWVMFVLFCFLPMLAPPVLLLLSFFLLNGPETGGTLAFYPRYSDLAYHLSLTWPLYLGWFGILAMACRSYFRIAGRMSLKQFVDMDNNEKAGERLKRFWTCVVLWMLGLGVLFFVTVDQALQLGVFHL